jgi:acyl-coenzyme A thioesterase PaaI-like protein
MHSFDLENPRPRPLAAPGSARRTAEDHVAPHDRLGPDQAAEDPIGLPWYVLADYRCFGCSPHNPHGIQLRFTHHGDGLRTVFRLGREHESYPGVVHGGLLGVIADEIMGNLIVLHTGQIPFTTAMRVRYVLPVLVGGSYECVANVRAGASQLLHTECEIREVGGAVVATATASYHTVSLDAAQARIALEEPDADRLREALAVTTAAHAPAVPHALAAISATAPTTRDDLAEESRARGD